LLRSMLAAAAVATFALPGLAACGGEDALTVYSGRNENLVGPLFEQFEDETGVDVEVRYGDSAELAATLAEEGDGSPADVFFAQDAGSLGFVAEEGLLGELPAELLAVDGRFRDGDGRWVGLSGRARVVAYNTDELAEGDLPTSIWEYAGPEWRSRVGIAPTNASFQAMVTAMRLAGGEERTRRWLEDLEGEARTYENNVSILEAIAAGEIDAGLVNHYYLYGLREEQPEAPVANHYLEPGDPGSLVNVAGAGILARTDQPQEAERLLMYLLDEGQRYFAAETFEYPLAGGVDSDAELPPLDEAQGPQLELGTLGPELEATLELLNEVGLTS
jgi:iron(III) transport system substrate-binding protein